MRTSFHYQYMLCCTTLLCLLQTGSITHNRDFNTNASPGYPPREPVVIVTDENWEVSNKQVNFGEYPLGAHQLPATGAPLPGGTAYSVEAAIFPESRVIPGTKPIWRRHVAQEDWEAYLFRKTIALDQQPVLSVTLEVNCDDAARVYINQKLVNPDRHNGVLNNARGGRSVFRDLTAFLYSEVKTYDVTGYFFTGVTNTILVEVANQPFTDNHAYLSARIRITFAPVPEVPQKISEPANPVRKTLTPPKTTPVTTGISRKKEKKTEPKPETVPDKPATETNVFQAGSTIDLGKLPVGSILELGNVLFKPDDDQLDSASMQTLVELANFLKAYPVVKIEVGGHTNLLPTEAFAQQLSERRAHSVASFLVEHGVPSTRITYRGYGKSRPKAAGTSSQANRQNQRVEIKILAK